MKKASLIFFALTLSLTSCDNYTFPETIYSRVKTLEVVRSNNGVILRAEILDLGNEPVLNHGFIWNDSQVLVGVLIGEAVELGPTDTKGIYEAEITGLTIGKNYYFRALLEGDQYEVRGNIVSFRF